MRRGEVGGGGAVYHTLVVCYHTRSKPLFYCIFGLFANNYGGNLISWDSGPVEYSRTK